MYLKIIYLNLFKGYSLNEIYNANMPTFYATRSTLNSCRSNGRKNMIN